MKFFFRNSNPAQSTVVLNGSDGSDLKAFAQTLDEDKDGLVYFRNTDGSVEVRCKYKIAVSCAWRFAHAWSHVKVFPTEHWFEAKQPLNSFEGLSVLEQNPNLIIEMNFESVGKDVFQVKMGEGQLSVMGAEVHFE